MSVIKYIVQATECPSMTIADANGDSVVDIKDLMRINKSIVENGKN